MATYLSKGATICPFQDEYKDDDAKSKDKTQEKKEETPENNEKVPSTAEASSVNLIDTSEENAINSEGAVNADLAGLRMDAGDMTSQMGSFMPSQMLQVGFYAFFIVNLFLV